MAQLTAADRNAMPQSQFALPGGRYPIPDASHAANAKARATQQYNAGSLSADQRAVVDPVPPGRPKLPLFGRSTLHFW